MSSERRPRRDARSLHLRSGAYRFQRDLWQNVGGVYDCRVAHTRHQEPRTAHYAERMGSEYHNAHLMTVTGAPAAVEQVSALMVRILADIEHAARSYLKRRYGAPALPEKLHSQTAHSFRAGATDRVIRRLHDRAEIKAAPGSGAPAPPRKGDARAYAAGARAGERIDLELAPPPK